jgi:amino acid transporter/nucleotide-binding universal stress UspA family protein
MPDSEQVTLARTLGFFDATMIGVGAMIGAGIFVLTGLAVGKAGPGALLAFALNGCVTLITAQSYAELASAIPEAGGGYAFAKQAFPGLVGFISGWMLWFAYTVACTLYAVGFGGYFVELLHSYLPALSRPLVELLGQNGISAVFAFIISIFFVSLNYFGANVTGKAENILTIAKIFILGLFSAFGVFAIFREPGLLQSNFQNFLPLGIGGVISAMGLTFIAFEGYDLIATVSEEIKDPTKNIPKAMFASLAIAITIYLLIIIVSVGAVDPTNFGDIFNKLPAEIHIIDAYVLDPSDPRINTTWEILGLYKETGIVRAAENFMPAIGVFLIVFGGLLSTMSALNATVMASSRVAFSMGREKMLPEMLSRIHPQRRTPYIAVLATGLIIVVMTVILPVEVVGSAASVLFLLSFALVNGALIVLRRRGLTSNAGYKVPFYPWLPALGIIINLSVAVFQFSFQPQAWMVSLLWIASGVVIYFSYAKNRIKDKAAAPILLEERIAQRDYTVMTPVNNPKQARLLGLLGSILAEAKGGELLALNIVQVPAQLSLSEGKQYLARGRALLQQVIEEGKKRNVPVHTLLRLGRNVSEVIQMTVEDQQVDLMVLGWPGYSYSEEINFSSVVDIISIRPPCDLAVVRFRERRLPEKILVATKGGVHATLALELAQLQADIFQRTTGRSSLITILTVLKPNASAREFEQTQIRLEKLVQEYCVNARIRIISEEDEFSAIMKESNASDLIIVHAPSAGLLEQRLFGNIPQRLAKECRQTVIMVKSHRPVQSWIRHWLGIRRNTH